MLDETSEVSEAQEQSPALALPEAEEETHNEHFLAPYVVYEKDGKYYAEEGPAPKFVNVVFGAESRLDAESHAQFLNRKTQGNA
jgi:hypothetical protein